MVIVTESFGYKSSPQDQSNLFFKKNQICIKNVIFRIRTLYIVMVTESFGYRPSPRDWSNIFFFKNQICKKNMVFQIRTLYMVMVTESFRDPLLRIGLICFSKSQICKKDKVFRIETLYMVMVIESFGYKRSHRAWSNMFFFQKKWFVGLGPSTW